MHSISFFYKSSKKKLYYFATIRQANPKNAKIVISIE